MASLRLGSLTLEGFKSFATRVELSFPAPITAIVGPNGTGKSNIADAIAWVLGEQSPRALRSQSMADVIFAGSPDRAPVGAAQVTLALRSIDPEDRQDGSSLEISRRVLREGSSEYRLGGRRVRLKDIVSHLMDAGLGTRAYAIIEQGRISQVLSLRSTDRRLLFEETAGITKFRARRHEAELKLAETRANLLRVGDIANEVKRTLAAARRQARKAERHRTIKGELLQVRAVLLAIRRADLMLALQEAQKTLMTREAEEAVQAADLARSEAELADRRNALEHLQESLAEVRREEAAADAGAQRREAEEAAARRELTEARARSEGAGQEVVRAKPRLEALRAEGEALTAALKSVQESLANAEEEALKAASAEEETAASARTAVSQAEESRRELLASVAAATEARNRLHRIEVELEQVGFQRSRLTAEHDRLQTHLKAAARAEEEAANGEATAGTKCQALERQRQALRAERDALAGTAAELNVSRDKAAHRRWQVHHERQGVFRTLASARALPKALARTVSDKALLGTVADFLDPSASAAPLLDSAYRELLSLPVIADEETLAELLASDLEAEGRLEVVVAHREAPGRPSPLLESGGASDGDLGWLSSALPRATAAEDAASAQELAMADPDLLVVLPNGARRQGTRVALAGAEASLPGVLALRARERELSAEEETLRDQEEAFATELATLSTTIAELDTSLSEADGAARQAAETQAAAVSTHQAAHRERARLESELEALEAERVRLQEEEASNKTRATAAAAESQRLAQWAEEIEGRVDDRSRRADTAREGASLARTSSERARGLVALVRERIASHKRDLERQGEEIARLEGEIATAQEEQLLQGLRAEEALASGVQARSDLEGLLESRAAAHRRVEGLERDETSLRERVEGATASTDRTRAAHLAARDATHEARLALSEAKAALERLEETVVHTLGEDWQLPEEPSTSQDLPSLEERESELALALEALGPVNELAVAERNELEERHRFLREQQRDLERSLASLNDTVKELDEECASRFRATLEEASNAFQKVFRSLFGGGDARVELADPDSPLEAGIEIRVRPPGKHAQSVLLLSGGEKALAAVAMLLALFSIRPAPFCVLDEVDAPLDDVNVERLCRLLRELSQDTQFLLITHNRRTMAHADVLYGVTMEEPGVSSIVSVRLED